MGMAAPGSPMGVEKPNWKQLSELPKLDIPAGEAWERNTVLTTWEKEVVLASTTVSVQFSDFVSKIMEIASDRYNHQKKNPRGKLSKPGPVPESLREYNNKLCVLLLPAIPEEVKTKVLGDVDKTRQISSLTALDEIWHY
eukprot:9751980-Lingulodinium_polyedra.AAC.1